MDRRAKKKTDGQLEIQFYNPNTLVPAKEVYNSLTAGSVDLGATAQWLSHGKFPLSDAISLPMMFNGAEAGSMTIWSLYKNFPEWREEYKDIKILWQWTAATLQLHTKKKEIKTHARALEDAGFSVASMRPFLGGGIALHHAVRR